MAQAGEVLDAVVEGCDRGFEEGEGGPKRADTISVRWALTRHSRFNTPEGVVVITDWLVVVSLIADINFRAQRPGACIAGHVGLQVVA